MKVSQRKSSRELLSQYLRERASLFTIGRLNTRHHSDDTFMTFLEELVWEIENVKTETLEADLKELKEDFKEMRRHVDFLLRNMHLQTRKYKSFERKFNKQMGIKK